MNGFVVTCYNDPLIYILKSNIIREAHSVGLELGVSSYEVELHINNR